jgi:hypothetical protein
MTREKAHPSAEPHDKSPFIVERVQTGVRIEKRILRVLKALAEYHDMSLGDLLEGIVLHAFEGKSPFSPETLRRVADLKKIYDLDLDASASHQLQEQNADAGALPERKKVASGDGRRARAGSRAGQR